MANIYRNAYCINQQLLLIWPRRFGFNLLSGCAPGSTSIAAVMIVMLVNYRRTDHVQTETHGSFIAVVDYRFWQTLPEVHHH